MAIPSIARVPDGNRNQGEDAREIRRLYDEFDMVYGENDKITKGFSDFYHGIQFTPEQEKEYEERGMPLLAINKVRPHIDHQAWFLTSKKIRPSIKPVEIGDTDLSGKLDDYFLYSWAESDGQAHHHQAVFDSLIYGRGFLKIWPDTSANFGRPFIRIESRHPHEIKVDPTARRTDILDARRVFDRAHFTADQIEQAWGVKAKDIHPSYDNDHVSSGYVGTREMPYSRGELDTALWSQSGRDYEVIESYERLQETWVAFWDDVGRMIGTVPLSEYKGQEDSVSGFGFTVREYKKPYIKQIVACGDVILEEAKLPISHYPIVPIFNSHNGTPFGVSEVSFLFDPQRAINAIQNMKLHFLATAANSPWVVEEGSVDEKTFRQTASVQGSILKFRRGATAPLRMPPQQPSQALFAMGPELEAHLQDVTGDYPLAQGNPDGAPESFRGTLQVEEFGGRKLARKMKINNQALRIIGNVWLQMVREYITHEEIFRIIGEDDKPKEVSLNSPGDDGQSLFSLQQGMYDFQVVEDLGEATSVMAREGLEFERFRHGLSTKRQYILNSSMRNKTELLQELDEISQLSGQIEQMQKMVKRRDIQIGQMENELRRAKRQEMLTETEADIEIHEQRVKSRIEIEAIKNASREQE